MLKTILIDLSGTLHIENNIIPGAVEALKRLRESNVLIKFVTNTTKESKNTLHARLSKLGFDLKKEEIFSSLSAAHDTIVKQNLRPMLLLSPDAIQDFSDLTTESPNAVVLGLAPTEFYYERLNDAFRCLLNGAKLIAIHAGKYYKRDDGLALGPGCFVKGLEYAAQCTAEIVGKPNQSFFRSALDNVSPEHSIMIGDDVADDIEGAMKAGIRGYLVKTGKYLPGDENKINPPPSKVFPSFVEVVDHILKEIK